MQSDPVIPPASQKQRPFWLQAIVLVMTRLTMNINGRMVYPFLPAFARGLGVSTAMISVALTARSLVAMTNPLFGVLADRKGRKPVILMGIGLAIGCAGLILIWPSYTAFFIYLCLTYLGLYMVIPAMQAYVSDQVPYEKRGRLIGLMETGWSLSFILGMPLVGWLMGRFGWLAPFPVLGGMELIFLGVILFVLPAGAKKQDMPDVKKQGAIRLVFQNPSARAAILMNVAFAASVEVILLVFGIWMEDSFQMQLAGLGLASAVIGFSELGGEGLSAMLSDRLGKKRTVVYGSIAFMAALLVFPFLSSQLFTALIVLALVTLTFEFTFVSAMPLTSEILPEARSTLIGMSMAAVCAGRALAAVIAPFLYQLGFQANIIMAMVFILLGLLALSRVKVAQEAKQSQSIRR